MIEGDVYLVPGAARHERRYMAYTRDCRVQTSAPLINIEQPIANATISGKATVPGWAFDNVALDGVSVYVDGIAMEACPPELVVPTSRMPIRTLRRPIRAGRSRSYEKTRQRLALADHSCDGFRR